MWQRKARLGLLIAVMLLVAACSKEGEANDDSPVKEDTPKVEKTEEQTKFAAPFTGVEFDEEKTMRPIIATINNDPKARPQSGISDADIVFEFLAEGAMTRLLALFQSELPEQIGPIRSARDYFLHTAKGLDAFYVAHGYSPDALALLKQGYVDNINGMQYDGSLFKRSSERKAPHNSYISGEAILQGMEDNHVHTEISKLPALLFYETVESAKIGDSASSVEVRYSANADFISTYMYDDETGLYTRYVRDEPTIDMNNDRPIEVANVLVLEAPHRTIDNEGRQAIDLQVGGQARLFQAGIVKQLEWVNEDGEIIAMENGEPAKFVLGKTWIHVVPSTPGMGTSVVITP